MDDYFKIFDKQKDPLSYTAMKLSLASPELIEKWSFGEVYAGWNPSAVPEMYDAEAYAARFAREAIIAPDDGGEKVQPDPATTATVLHHLPPPQMDKALDQLPREIRTLLQAQR